MIRIGIGNDTHRLVEGRSLVLGGVQITSDRGAEGHSDAEEESKALQLVPHLCVQCPARFQLLIVSRRQDDRIEEANEVLYESSAHRQEGVR